MQLQQADRIEVENTRRPRLPAHRHRITGHRQQVADAEEMRAHQLGMQADQIAIAAGDVHDDVDAGIFLDAPGEGDIAQPDARQGIFRQTDGIGAGRRQPAGTGENFRAIEAARRIEFNRYDRPFSPRGEKASVPSGFCRRRDDLRQHGSRQLARCGTSPGQRRRQRPDMLGGSAAAAADERGTGAHHVPAGGSEIFRGCQVNVAAIDILREAGVGKSGKRPGAGAAQPLHDLQHLARPAAAVGADYSGAGGLQAPGGDLYRHPFAAAPFLQKSHLRHRRPAEFGGDSESELQLFQSRRKSPG